MKQIQEILDELFEDGVPEDEIRKVATEQLRKLIDDRITLTGPPNPAVISQIGQQHLRALFEYVFSIVYAAASDGELEKVLKDFNEYADFDVASRYYQALVVGGQNAGS